MESVRGMEGELKITLFLGFIICLLFLFRRDVERRAKHFDVDVE